MTAVPPVNFLLVDDLKGNLVSLEALLKRENVVILKAQSGDEALELLLRHEVALALLDVHMPEMNGFELAEFMRGNERTRHVPIIFVTADTTDAHRRFRGYEAGAVDFIQKPIEADVLRSKANVFYDLYRQRQLLAAQRDELEAASKALLIADRRKDEFLAVLAHELRNPVAALQSGLHLLHKREGTEAAASVREGMARQLVHLGRLVDDLLDISRISEGKISLQKDLVELRVILQSGIEGSKPNIEAADHSFTLSLPEQEVWLRADVVRMAQVVTNLLNNAAKYTPRGGAIFLGATCDDGYVEISIRDNGMGIPAEMQTRIFNIFEQVEAHRAKAAGGLGIGLALVRQLVELHDGVIGVESPGEGRGSTFRVTIPANCDELDVRERFATSGVPADE